MACIAFSIAVTCYVLVSVVTYAVYGYDKRRASSKRFRVAERTMHTLELAGGWPGAALAQRRFKHKRRKREYMLVYRLIVALHLLLWALVMLVWWVAR